MLVLEERIGGSVPDKRIHDERLVPRRFSIAKTERRDFLADASAILFVIDLFVFDSFGMRALFPKPRLSIWPPQSLRLG